jgi:hypothetical protein
MSLRKSLDDIKKALERSYLFDALFGNPGDAPASTAGASSKTMQTATILRFTTTERDALAAGAKYVGMIIYNTTTNKLNFWTGAAWQAVTSV